MASIQMLREYAKTGGSIYAMLKATRIEDKSKPQKPFEQVDPKEVILMIYKWSCERPGRLTTVQLRMHDHSHDIMHYVGLRAHRKHIYVMYVHDLPSNQHQITHVWKPSTIFTNLTIEEIHDSVTRAQEVNQLAVSRQTHGNMPLLNALLKSEIPEAEGPEILQVNSGNPDLEAIEELLQGEGTM